LAEELKREFDADVTLIKSKNGVFEVTVDGRLIFSKRKLGRHAEPGEIKTLLQGK